MDNQSNQGKRFPQPAANTFSTAGSFRPQGHMNQASQVSSNEYPYKCHRDKMPCIKGECAKWIEVEEEPNGPLAPFHGYCLERSRDEAVEELAKDAKEKLEIISEFVENYGPVLKSFVINGMSQGMMSGNLGSQSGGLFGSASSGKQESGLFGSSKSPAENTEDSKDGEGQAFTV